jgi:hypothetical protein
MVLKKFVWHKFSISFWYWTNMDGVEKVCLAQTLHPLSASVKLDGMTDMK